MQHKARYRIISIGLATALAAWMGGAVTSRSGAQTGEGQPTAAQQKDPSKANQETKPEHIVKTDAEWRKLLTPMQFYVTRRAGTERAYTGAYWNNHEPGVYKCVDCGQVLFSSKTKFDSGTGWPSFYKAIAEGRVKTREDDSGGEVRTEVLCSRCDAHLGHVFNDGPAPTGLRYCMNSAALKFVKDAPPKKSDPAQKP